MTVGKINKVSPQDFINLKNQHEKITILTAYDYSLGKIFDTAGIDALLVGDSLGMVIMGEESTLHVTIEDVIHHTKAVSRAATHSMVIADMPFMSFALPEEAVKNAGRCVKEGNADAVKLEGGRERVKSIRMMLECGIPVMGHIGLTPQYVHLLGGYKLQGKNALAAERLVEDALILEEAGVFGLVLEMVPWQVAKEISSRLHIPTIGIGAGPWCDGQVLVSYDMLGYSSSQKFRFVKQYANLYDVISNAASEYIKDIKQREFPALSQSFEMPEEEWHQFQDIMARKPQIQRETSSNPLPRNRLKETELGKVYGE